MGNNLKTPAFSLAKGDAEKASISTCTLFIESIVSLSVLAPFAKQANISDRIIRRTRGNAKERIFAFFKFFQLPV
jgi:hypothetical protein